MVLAVWSFEKPFEAGSFLTLLSEWIRKQTEGATEGDVLSKTGAHT